jgi:hypothetical protein
MPINATKEKTGEDLRSKGVSIPSTYYLAMNYDKKHQETNVLN